jgi:hypothetical protein
MSKQLPENIASQVSEYLDKNTTNSELVSEIFAADLLPVVSHFHRNVQLNMKDGRKLYFTAVIEVTRVPNDTDFDQTERVVRMEPYKDGVPSKYVPATTPKPKPIGRWKKKYSSCRCFERCICNDKPKEYDASIFAL